MRSTLALVIFSFLFIGCFEDERASDFELNYDISWRFLMGDVVEGSIKNISSTPAHSITLKVYMYNCDYDQIDTDYIEINQTLNYGDVAEFCSYLTDSTEYVEMIVYLVD